MIQWHVFLSVSKHPYSGNFAGHASLLICPTTDYNPYSAKLAGHALLLTSYVLSQSFSKPVFLTIAVNVLGMLQHTDIERLYFSLAVKMPNFWGPKIDKKVIDSSTQCLISVKIAILTPHIIPHPVGKCLVDIWFAEIYVNWFCLFLEVNPCFQRIHIFCTAWIYSQLQIHTVLYVGY